MCYLSRPDRTVQRGTQPDHMFIFRTCRRIVMLPTRTSKVAERGANGVGPIKIGTRRGPDRADGDPERVYCRPEPRNWAAGSKATVEPAHHRSLWPRALSPVPLHCASASAPLWLSTMNRVRPYGAVLFGPVRSCLKLEYAVTPTTSRGHERMARWARPSAARFRIDVVSETSGNRWRSAIRRLPDLRSEQRNVRDVHKSRHRRIDAAMPLI